MPEVVNASTAIEALRITAIKVEALENERNKAIANLSGVEANLHTAQERFNEARVKALEYVPALESGFPIKTETVAIGGDGKVHVVEE